MFVTSRYAILDIILNTYSREILLHLFSSKLTTFLNKEINTYFSKCIRTSKKIIRRKKLGILCSIDILL